MSTQPVILLNIKETIQVLDGLSLYALAEGNEGSRKIDNYRSCLKFQVMTTNIKTGAQVRRKYALHGQLVARKGVGVDHVFVIRRIWDALKEHLARNDMIISNDAAPGVFMSRAIWRYIFAAGTRVVDYANGIGIFSQPQETNFSIGVDPIEKLLASRGTFTLAIANDNMVKFYLGEEFPIWGTQPHDPEDKVWTPCKKKVTAPIVSACLEHFTNFISQENKLLEVFPANKFDDLLLFVEHRLTLPRVESTSVEVTKVVEPAWGAELTEDESEYAQPEQAKVQFQEAKVQKGSKGLLRRLLSPLTNKES